jgi:hypothetical protein
MTDNTEKQRPQRPQSWSFGQWPANYSYDRDLFNKTDLEYCNNSTKDAKKTEKCVICERECSTVVCSKKCWMEMGGLSASPPDTQFDFQNKYFK